MWFAQLYVRCQLLLVAQPAYRSRTHWAIPTTATSFHRELTSAHSRTTSQRSGFRHRTALAQGSARRSHADHPTAGEAGTIADTCPPWPPMSCVVRKATTVATSGPSESCSMKLPPGKCHFEYAPALKSVHPSCMSCRHRSPPGYHPASGPSSNVA